MGQGDILSPARAKLVMGVVQRALARMLPGVSLDAVQPGAPFLVYADDGMLLADSPNTLQHAYDAIWMTAAALGLDITVKGKKKTAWAGVWYQGGIPRDCEGWEMRLPDGKGINGEGTLVPQLTAGDEYKYLGTELPTGWKGSRTQSTTRCKMVRACKNVIRDVGSLQLAPDTLDRAMNLAVAGIVGSYGTAGPRY